MSADSKDPVSQFIDSIPDAKLLDLPKNPGARIFTTNDYRLDMQSMTSDKPAKHNIQNNQWTAKMIQDQLKAKIIPFVSSVKLAPQGGPLGGNMDRKGKGR